MISDLLVNIDSEPNIIYGIKEKIGYGVCKFDIYNIDVDNPMQKFWFFIKKAKVIEIDSKYITIAFTGNLLIKYITLINNNILNYINKNINKNIKTIDRTINSISQIPKLRINIEENTCVFNKNGKCSINDLSINSDISIYLEINHIIVTATNAWIIWNGLQIKSIQEIDFSKEFFEEPIITTKKVISDIQPHLYIHQKEKRENISHREQKSPTKFEHNKLENNKSENNKDVHYRFSVSQSELLNQIKKLNKIKKEIIIPEKSNNNLNIEQKIQVPEITVNDMEKTIKEYENNIISDSDDEEYDKKMNVKYNSVINKLNSIFAKK